MRKDCGFDGSPRLLRRLRRDAGQAILLFVGGFTLIAVAGAIVVDFGLWFSERRGAQKDADMAALAGALQLVSDVDYNDPLNPAVVPAAEAAALAWAAANGVDPEDVLNLTVSSDCFSADDGVYDSVSLDVDRDSRSLFASIFGLLAPDIGAHARACMGSPYEGTGMLPIGVQVVGQDSDCFQNIDDDPEEEPLFGIECKLGFGAGTTTSGEGGLLRLYNDGSLDCSSPNTGGGNTVTDEIASGGADTTCYVAPPGTTAEDCVDGVNFCVWPKTQPGGTNPVQKALQDLLSGDGACDALFGDELGTANGRDDFLEVVKPVNGDLNADPGTTTYEKRPECDSPRLISLVIIDSFSENGNGPAPIRAFASFFIKGCVLDGAYEPYCAKPSGSVGQTELWGFFINTLNIGRIGPINEYGQRAIALVE
ncbi:MAG TPA: Tad domain-containing protein [Dehalococcoidia bacterium]|nr:Tad domain-containing protein [Dehalococcoidia bacterium]